MTTEQEEIMAELKNQPIELTHIGEDYFCFNIGKEKQEITGYGRFIIAELITRNQEYANTIEILREEIANLKAERDN